MSGTAFAQNTASGVTISNTATVNYSVNSIAQTAINATTSFVVDTVVNVNVTGGVTTNVTPGQNGAATAFTVTNTGNAASNYTLTPANLGGDQFQVGTIDVRVDDGDGLYEAAEDTATAITGLARNGSITVFVIGNIPVDRVNNDQALVQLQANAIDPGTGLAWVNDTGADVQGGLPQIVVASLTDLDQDTFLVVTATLGVTKTSTVVRDPFNLTTNPKAIPSAVMEYAIAIANTGAEPATLQSISDPIPVNTTFLAGDYAGSTDVSIQSGAAPATFCVAEAGGTDSNADGCVRTVGGALTVGAPAITTVADGSTVTVRFRVTIN
jgi:uncharacterized repeat protein (TIGR01451 family)